jgi:hypothetical protein
VELGLHSYICPNGVLTLTLMVVNKWEMEETTPAEELRMLGGPAVTEM